MCGGKVYIRGDINMPTWNSPKTEKRQPKSAKYTQSVFKIVSVLTY